MWGHVDPKDAPPVKAASAIMIDDDSENGKCANRIWDVIIIPNTMIKNHSLERPQRTKASLGIMHVRRPIILPVENKVVAKMFICSEPWPLAVMISAKLDDMSRPPPNRDEKTMKIHQASIVVTICRKLFD